MNKNDQRNRFICIAGKNDIACDSLTFLLDSGLVDKERCSVLLSRPSGKMRFMKSLDIVAHTLGVQIIDGIEKLYAVENLVFFSLEYDRIIDTNQFISKELFNVHFSKLPAYRGVYTCAWAILNGGRTTGVTMHKIDNGIDTGDIVDQIEFPIETGQTCRDLYFKCNRYGVELFKRNIRKILDRNYKAKPQSGYGASYYSKSSIDYKNLRIDLNKTAFEVHNQIRAFIFPEYQLPKVYDWHIAKSEISNERSSLKPGKIVVENENFLEIATVDYNIRCYKKKGDHSGSSLEKELSYAD